MKAIVLTSRDMEIPDKKSLLRSIKVKGFHTNIKLKWKQEVSTKWIAEKHKAKGSSHQSQNFYKRA
ncbi:hypothetical protein CAP51_13755 [Acinetobacter populi]|uniref:Uncharacterized protein n=1 Tax=Acinetobacter populi TaxID=1582270 RepID=A0A1Z9YVT0_9GAMM|nr:hypothetical protein CAP51_13755 [Acinetobacter populi]